MREIEQKLDQGYINHYSEGLYDVRNHRFAEMLARYADAPLRIFEFAGSGGFLAREIISMLPERSIEYYHHSDGSPDMVENAKCLLPRRENVLIETIDMVGQFDAISWTDYNVFVCANIEHLPNDMAIVEAMPPGALVLINTPTYDSRWHHFHTPCFCDLMARYWRYIDFLEFERIDKPHPGLLRRNYGRLLKWSKLPLADDLIKRDSKLIFIGRRRA